MLMVILVSFLIAYNAILKKNNSDLEEKINKLEEFEALYKDEKAANKQLKIEYNEQEIIMNETYSKYSFIQNQLISTYDQFRNKYLLMNIDYQKIQNELKENKENHKIN